MKNKKTNYQVSIGYKAYIQIDVKADSEDDAKKIALQQLKDYEHFGKGAEIVDSNYKADGVVDMDATWNMVQK